MNISSIIILTVFVEGFIEYFISKKGVTQPWLRYVSLLLGMIICLVYNADMFALLGLVSPIPYVGSLLTGAVVGRGSNYLNDFVSKFFSKDVVVK